MLAQIHICSFSCVAYIMIEEVSIIHANLPILDCLQLEPSLERRRLHQTQ
ncbi:hypothetical protein MJO28_004595 [Puccinia striiformis f. sp. tritici]|uniref:Uncharacterized protein n=1 Tax=Puccinia striiformis f. sp. tritici TaxID=168172 RepID=A0ACC0EQL7_9BASI|nr:hypothetical protein MJO28_004595 [Puccinia striiformis f. sp. tritici]